MDELQRADFARQILDNPLFVEAFAALQNDLERQRQAVKLTDTDAHTKLIMAEQVMAQFRRVLTRAIEDGEVAEFRLKQSRVNLASVFRR